jgi:hypothetical protein
LCGKLLIINAFIKEDMVMRKYILGIALIAVIVTVAGCILIDDVVMPDTACVYSSFHVTINTHIYEDGGAGAWGILGILIPVGWEPVNVEYSGPYSGYGVYDENLSYYTFEYTYPAPEGYIWWGYYADQSIEGYEGDEYAVDFDVITDGQLGAFFLDFAIGWENMGRDITDYSEDNEITIFPDQENPYINYTYPHDVDWPSGVPPTENTAGCHWNGGDPDTNSFINVDESTFEVRDSGGNPVSGNLNIDDTDSYDVIVDFQADEPWLGGETYTVETTTYDMVGNSATAIWDFTTGYLNINTSSFGAIKALYAE